MIRQRVRDFFDDYAALLDACEFDSWLELFEEDATYQATARENVDQELCLATIRADSRAMLADRLRALVETQFFAPRTMRHLVSGVRVTRHEPLETCAQASFLIAESMHGEFTHLHTVGEYRAVLSPDSDDALRVRDMLAIYDGALIDTSLIYPL